MEAGEGMAQALSPGTGRGLERGVAKNAAETIHRSAHRESDACGWSRRFSGCDSPGRWLHTALASGPTPAGRIRGLRALHLERRIARFRSLNRLGDEFAKTLSSRASSPLYCPSKRLRPAHRQKRNGRLTGWCGFN